VFSYLADTLGVQLQELFSPVRTTKNQDFEPAYAGFVPVASGFSLKAFRV